MTDFKLVYGRHPSKRIVFRSECGGCGKPLRRNSKNKVGFICRNCGPKDGRLWDNSSSVCRHCPFEMDCTTRVQLGLWIRCETPDIADLERLRFAGGLDDDGVRTEVDKALAQSGDRKVLEKAVSQSASKIYQGHLEGGQGKMPIGIRK